MRKLCLSPDKKFLGVCGGIADYLNVDVVIIRIMFVLIALATAVVPCLLAYVLAALILPPPPENYYEIYNNNGRKLFKNKDKKIAGVCGGFAEYFGIDATVIRLVLALLLLFFGYGIIAYIVCAIMMPERDYRVQ